MGTFKIKKIEKLYEWVHLRLKIKNLFIYKKKLIGTNLI